ncbi:MAG: cytochrome c [Acidobacteriota bacterium]|nr:cytochrome c [Acidobacteriota bacterium]
MSLYAFSFALMIAGVLLCEASEEDRKTVWDGVYTSAQAGRGEVAYGAECSQCHGEDLSGFSNALRGGAFMNKWREDNLGSLFTRVKSMPPSAPGSLGNGVYLDILAYILQVNKFPSGTEELKSDVLSRIQVRAKGGPQPVPDFALVEVTGCLAKGESGTWRLIDAGEPVRTRNPSVSSLSELKLAASQPSGDHTFRLLDTDNRQTGFNNGQKMKAKGFLIRKPEGDQINITFLERVGPRCGE